MGRPGPFWPDCCRSWLQGGNPRERDMVSLCFGESQRSPADPQKPSLSQSSFLLCAAGSVGFPLSPLQFPKVLFQGVLALLNCIWYELSLQFFKSCASDAHFLCPVYKIPGLSLAYTIQDGPLNEISVYHIYILIKLVSPPLWICIPTLLL